MTKRAQGKLPQGVRVRAAAARALYAVRTDGRALTAVLSTVSGLEDPRDEALVQEISYGALRRLSRLEAFCELLLRQPFNAADRDVEALVLIGLYQLDAMRIPPHAVVSSTVDATRALGKPRTAGLVNAVLRRFLREHQVLEQRIVKRPEAKWWFPGWLLKRLCSDWPNHWQAIVEASNEHPPMCLRVNLDKISRADYAEILGASGIIARPVSTVAAGLLLDKPIPAELLPGFADGQVSIQDASAQLAAQLLDPRAGESVLDACAAPGGKTAHLLEYTDNEADVTAIDIDPERLSRVCAGLDRLGLTARVEQGDAARPQGHWADRRYQRILLDLPCSATGVIRRHPDIKWLRRDSDIEQLASMQAQILAACWELLEPGGILLYVTCSLLSQENEKRILKFLERHADAREMRIVADWGIERKHGRQTLPTIGEGDGFFYAKLQKSSQ